MPTGWTPAAASSTLEEWTRTFSRGQQCSCFRTRNTFCRTRSLSNATFFIFWSRHENRIIFHRDMAIYRFLKWRPFAILELFYHHTRQLTKSLLMTAAACQILCQSDTQIWRYSCLNFSHIWLEMPIQVPKVGVLGDCGYLSPRPPKGTSLRKSASFKLSTVKIRWGVWPVGELTESVMDTHTDRQTHLHTHTHK